MYVYAQSGSVKLYMADKSVFVSVQNGTELTRIGISTGADGYWSRVLYNGQEYYVLTESLSKLSTLDVGFVATQKTVTINDQTGSLSVRSIPTNEGGSIMGYVVAGVSIKVVAENTTDGWYKIEFIPGGSEELMHGYISSDPKYFVDEAETETDTDTSDVTNDELKVEDAVTSFEDGTAYYGVLAHNNLGKLVYMNGEMDGAYYLGETDDISLAAKVYFEQSSGLNKYMYFYNGAAKSYVNVASDGEHYNLKLESTPSTEWHYNETYKCPMANVDGELMFIGTSDTGTYTNLCIKRISDGPTFFKLQFISAGVSDGGNDNDGECKHADVEIVGCEKVCNDCGVALGTEHSGETTIDKDTCDILCAACGRFLREGTHKLEIDIDDNCNYKCVLCGHVEEEGRHQELVVETRDPTASSEGWIITRCKDCNAIVSEDTIPPLGDGGNEDDTSLKVNGAVSNFKDGTAYYAVLAHQNLGKRLYLTGQIDKIYYLGATETFGSAAYMYVKSVSDDEYYIYFEVEKVRYYVNIIADGQYFDINLEQSPKSVWSFDQAYGTLITSVNDTWLFLGTDSTATHNNICIKSINYADSFFKLQFVEADGYVEDPKKENAETVTVSTADDLLSTISKLNSGEISKYSTIELGDDIDLSGKSFTPIKEFCGTFDGKGYKISNISLPLSGASINVTDGNYRTYDITAIGFIASAYDATIQNLTLDGITVEFNTDINVFVGALVGYADGVSIADCTVNSTMDVTVGYSGTSGVSGLIGYSLDTYAEIVEIDCNIRYTGNSTEAFAGAILGSGNIRIDYATVVLDISFTGDNYGHTGYIIGMERTPHGVDLSSAHNSDFTGTLTVDNGSGYCYGAIGQGAESTISQMTSTAYNNTVNVTVNSNASRN